MNRQFIAFTFKIFLSLLCYALLVGFIGKSAQSDAPPPYIAALFQAIENNEVNAELDRTHISVVDWSESIKNKIKQQEIIFFETDDEVFFYQYKDNFVYELGPLPKVEQNDQLWVFNLAYYIGMILILLLWLRPLLKDLFILSGKTEQFADGDKLVEVHLKPSSLVSIIACSFNSMARKIFDLIQLQKSISGMVGHEIRTPLSRIQLSLDIIKATTKDPELLEELTSMEEDVTEVYSLTEEFLNLTRCQHYNDELPVSLAEPCHLISNLIAKLERTSSCDIELQCENTAPALLEPLSFTRMMQNLIVNAMKYGKSKIIVTYAKDGNDNVIVVEDDGDGFVDIERVAQPYYRETAKGDGYGLGLSIAEMIAAWHKGTITFHQSDQLGGAKVKFCWPSVNGFKAPKQTTLDH
ncbi:hypothetical protein LP316_02095 [Thalassotalea sp. LPB0316]|uniref:ATP-binding protein n=1 Tax=Thalassotalea sp. LPB0316 TaxID=2769490 RepID=UPI0018693BE4|nr:ATP-binding protein [Thalassotalea sp. LPB0316]QOL26123.1 hypothetical protein LP316_02095 [Thalassotalea sp. LPB0316]